MTAEEKGIWSCQNKESWQLKKRTCTCTCLKYRQINRNSILLVTAVIWILVLITISVPDELWYWIWTFQYPTSNNPNNRFLVYVHYHSTLTSNHIRTESVVGSIQWTNTFLTFKILKLIHHEYNIKKYNLLNNLACMKTFTLLKLQ